MAADVEVSTPDLVILPLQRGYRLSTSGAMEVVGFELQADVQEDWAIPDGADIVRRAIVDLAVVGQPLGRRSSWGGHRTVTWVRDGKVLIAHETSSGDERELIPGIQSTAKALGSQRWVCSAYGAPFEPSADDDLVAIDPSALLASEAVEGVRYKPLSAGSSGWILISGGFKGGVADLENRHAYHITHARPDLERYFGLPPGWRFYRTAEGENVYQDPDPDAREA